MENSRNFILAISLSVLIIFAWDYFFVPKHVTNEKSDQEIKSVEISQKSEQIDQIISREEAIIKNPKRVKINSKELAGSISLKGLRFDDLTLKNYRVSTKENSPLVNLLNPSSTSRDYFAEFGWISQNKQIEMPTKSTIWQADRKILKENSEVNFFWINKQGIKFATKVKLDDKFMFTVTQFVENVSANDIVVSPFGFINRIQKLEDTSEFAILHEGPIGVFDGKLQEASYKDLTEKDKKFDEMQNGWFGFSDKYWLTAIIPDKYRNYNTRFFHRKNGEHLRFQVDYVGQPIVVSSGTTVKVNSNFFAGAKKLKTLDFYADKHDIYLFDRAVDFGWLYPITKPIFYGLQFANMFLGNFGLAIICITIFIKLLMFPVANKSYRSMNAMKKIQPELIKLKEKHAGEPMVLNQKVMELYKKEKVNPLSGCLPILLQIPVFFALYKVIFVTIEMRHAPFYGWISDLSAPDPTSVWNLFGLLPYEAPNFLSIGLWPVIMAVTMYFQQKMNPAPTDPVQAQVMKFLPLIFLFMFFNFPAGLVLYWAWNNILSVIQQYALTRNKD